VAVKNAIKVALRAVESRMTDHIGRRLAVDPAATTAAASPVSGA
jgi:hypothetical protein